MNQFQLIILAVGVLLVVSNFVDLKGLLSKIRLPLIDNGGKADKVIVLDEEKKIYKVVQAWEGLREECERYGLEGSVSCLDKVYPTFIDLVKKETKTNE